MSFRFGSRREQERLLKRLGIKLEEIKGVKSVIIETDSERIVFDSPIVTKMVGGPQEIYQIIGEPSVEKIGEEYVPPEEDVLLVAKQTGKSTEEARKALVATGGDIAQAIVLLQSGGL